MAISRSKSNFPRLSREDLVAFCHKCEIIDKKGAKLSTIDRIFIEADYEDVHLQNNVKKSLVRFEFLEALIRISNAKYVETGACKNVDQAFKKLIEECIFPNLALHEWQQWRSVHLWTIEVDDLFRANEAGIRKVYSMHAQNNKMSLASCTKLFC